MRHWSISRHFRKTREWLHKPVITSLQFAQMTPALQREMLYWFNKQDWRLNINQNARYNPAYGDINAQAAENHA